MSCRYLTKDVSGVFALVMGVLLAIAGGAQAQQKQKADGIQTGSLRPSSGTLKSGDLEMRIDSGTATISAMSVRGHSLMVGRQGYVAVEDRTTGKFHFKPEQAVAVEVLKDDGIAFRQTDDSADMTVVQRFFPKGDCIEWSVEVNTERSDLREIHLHFVVPIFGTGSHGFTAHSRCPMIPETGNDHMMVVYSPNMWNEESFHCSVLPMVSSYDPKTDAGLAVVQPVDVAKPRMEFFFVREQPDISLVVRWTHLRLVHGQSTKAKMLLYPIRGCWRDALRVVHDLYPDYFRVHQPAVFAFEGPATSAPIIHEDGLDKLVRQQHLSWLSLHARAFSRFGEYAPEEESWPSWVRHWKLEYFDLERLGRTEFRWLQTRVPDKKVWKEETITRTMINDYIDRLHQKGVAILLYSNPVIASIDRIDAYPGSLATSAEGTPLFRDYHRTAPFNPAANTTWGKHLDSMTQRMLSIFPEMDGLFLDELHYNQFDFAHDDGVSARGDKPVAMLGFAVQDFTRRLCDMVHQRGKVVWSNGTNTLEVAHYVDGLMAEVKSEWLGTILYLSLEKPLVLLFGKGPWTVAQLEDDLNTALFAGAQPGALHNSTSVVPDVAPELLAVLERYRPLFQMLRGRKWILHPHAISTDVSGLKTNCFALPDGDFAVALSRSNRFDVYNGPNAHTTDQPVKSEDRRLTDKGKTGATAKTEISIRLRWPGLDTVRSAKLMDAAQPDKPLQLNIRHEKDGLSLDVPHVEAGIIRLSGDGAQNDASK